MVRALASHRCDLGSIPVLGIMWVEFVVGSCPCSKRFFSGSSGFPLSSKANISKFQFNLDSVEEEPPNPINFIYIYLFILGTFINEVIQSVMFNINLAFVSSGSCTTTSSS